jgi:transposase, IS5 family
MRTAAFIGPMMDPHDCVSPTGDARSGRDAVMGFLSHTIDLPFDRSSMTRWRQRMGEERIMSLLQESLSVAVKTGAMRPEDTRRVIVDTTVQPKNIMFPTDAKLLNRARERLVALAKKVGLDLRQSYVRVGKFALMRHQRYAHARQFKRAHRALRTLRTYLGRTIRDITRQIAGEDDPQDIFRKDLHLASRVLEQRQNQRGRKVYSLHAPEVECIGKGKAHAPYEFGVKVSIATTLQRSRGGQFALHAKALPGNPYDGHTLATVIPDMERSIGNGITRILADAGYRGHNAPLSHRFKVYTSGQKRRMTPAIKREMRRRSAVEPVIGHIKNGHRMDRNYLAGPQGDAINAVLAAAGYNFRLILNWLRLLLVPDCQPDPAPLIQRTHLRPRERGLFTWRYRGRASLLRTRSPIVWIGQTARRRYDHGAICRVGCLSGRDQRMRY